jgi:hypothetical protein
MNFEIAPKSTEKEYNWYDARLYCFALTIDGKSGWRLPTKEELYEIHKSANDFKNEWYWSSSETSVNGAWSQNFLYGNRFSYSKNDFIYVRAVRDLL